MVFDEGTSSLDSQAEQKILQAMESVRGEYTSVIIAHRLSTIVDADKIIVLDQGRVVEMGGHTELLRHNGFYARLWELQDGAGGNVESR
jgi:ATP-binding cassette subfamily B protein